MTRNCEWGNCFCSDCCADRRRNKACTAEERAAAKAKAKAEKEEAKANCHKTLTAIGKDRIEIIDTAMEQAKAELRTKYVAECTSSYCNTIKNSDIMCALCGRTPQTCNEGNTNIDE